MVFKLYKTPTRQTSNTKILMARATLTTQTLILWFVGFGIIFGSILSLLWAQEKESYLQLQNEVQRLTKIVESQHGSKLNSGHLLPNEEESRIFPLINEF